VLMDKVERWVLTCFLLSNRGKVLHSGERAKNGRLQTN